MEIKHIKEQTIRLSGNISRGKGVYIIHENMKEFVRLLHGKKISEGFTITPFLLSTKGGLYELYEYEFDISIKNEPTHYEEYNEKNLLPAEIISYLKPQLIIYENDNNMDCSKAVEKYINNMEKMSFFEVKKMYSEFKEAKLVYQIYLENCESF